MTRVQSGEEEIPSYRSSLSDTQSSSHLSSHHCCSALGNEKESYKTTSSFHLLQVLMASRGTFSTPKEIVNQIFSYSSLMLPGQKGTPNSFERLFYPPSKRQSDQSSLDVFIQNASRTSKNRLVTNMFPMEICFDIYRNQHNTAKLICGFFFFLISVSHNKSDINKGQSEAWNQLLNHVFRTKQSDQKIWKQTAL